MSKRLLQSAFASLALLLALIPASAQQKDPRVVAPIGPLSSISADESSSKAPGESPATAAPAATPDKRPLSGLEDFSLGMLTGGRSYFVPMLDYSSIADSNGLSTGGSYNWNAISILRGAVTLNKIWDRAQTQLEYTSGGTIHSTSSRLQAFYHRLGATHTITGRRWSLLFSDQYSRLPDTSLGFGGIGLISDVDTLQSGINGTLGGNLNPGFLPNQTVLNSRSTRISNSAATQVQYTLTRRSSVTFSTSYGLLRFDDEGLLDSSSWAFQGGYNYTLSPEDTIAVSYGYSFFRFAGSAQKTNNQTVMVSYGRRLTGRMSLQLGAGPQLSTLDDPVNGQKQRLNMSVRAGMIYRFPQVTYNVTYVRQMTGGAGVFRGAGSNLLRIMANRQLSRLWSGWMETGYAFNRSLGNVDQTTMARAYHSYQSSLGVRRTLGRYTSLMFSYSLQLQTGDGNSCTANNCRSALRRHSVQFGLNWRFRPIELE